MKDTMRAVYLMEPKKFEMKEIPIPEPGPRDVVFKVIYAGVCGSDFPIYNLGMFVPSLPQIIGHEFSGVVVKKGDEVTDVEIGDRIMGTNIEWCGECEYCKAGDHWSCPHMSDRGLGFGVPGVFAEYSTLFNPQLGIGMHKLPDTANDLQLAAAEPMCVGAGNVPAVDVQSGDKVVIFGAGIIGQSHLQRAKLIPDVEVAVVDSSPLRLGIAKKLGADHIINFKDGDAALAIMKIWGDTVFPYNYGENVSGKADVVFECSGNATAFTQAFKVVRPNGGKVCIAGTCKEMAQIHPQWIELKNPKIFSGMNGDFGGSVQLIGTGEFKVDDLITHIFPLEELEEAFRVAQSPEESLKVMIKVDESAPDYPYNKQKPNKNPSVEEMKEGGRVKFQADPIYINSKLAF